MSVIISPPMFLQFFDPNNSGAPLAGGLLFTYIAGTSTKQATWTDSTQTVQNSNPIILDSNGAAYVWLDPTLLYKFVLSPRNDTDPPSSPLRTVDNIQGMATLSTITAQFIGNLLYPRTIPEIALGVTPVNFTYPPGHVYRYGTNTSPNTTDMTAVINTAANVCRQGNYILQVPLDSKLRVTSSLDFSALHVVGLGSAFGDNLGGGIQASNAQFDVIISTGLMIIENLWVDGGWDGVTAGLTGDILSLKAVSPAHPYVNTLSNSNFQNAKARGIYIERGGYTGMFHMHVVQCGLHALECFGLNTDACTSIGDYGRSQFGGTPFGYGIKLTECAAMIFNGTIVEATNGIQLNGLDNRTLVFDGIYEEFNPTPSFTASITTTTLTVTAPATLAGLGVGSVISGAGVTANTVIIGGISGTGGIGTYTVNNSQTVGSEAMTATPLLFVDNSAGLGLAVKGMFGANLSFPFAPGVASFRNWSSVYFDGNSNLIEGPIPLGGRIQTNSAGQSTISATGDVTVAQLSLSPGLYRLYSTVQTIISSGGGTLTLLASQITTNSAATSPANSLSPLVEGAAQIGNGSASIGPSQDSRVNAFTEVQVFATTIYYVRAHMTLSGTITLGYAGQLRAELVE